MALTLKQEIFVDEYFKNAGNCYAAAMAAGYAVFTAKTASRWLEPTNKNSNKKNKEYKPELAAAIEAKREELKKAKVAEAREIMEYFTSVMRGESRSEVVVVEGCGDGVSEARAMEKRPDEKERLKAGELLGKCLGIFSERSISEAGKEIVGDPLTKSLREEAERLENGTAAEAKGNDDTNGQDSAAADQAGAK